MNNSIFIKVELNKFLISSILCISCNRDKLSCFELIFITMTILLTNHILLIKISVNYHYYITMKVEIV